MTRLLRLLSIIMTICLMAGLMPVSVCGADVVIVSDTIKRVKTGKTATISFEVRNYSGREIRNLAVGFDISGGEIWDEDEYELESGNSFPFEIIGSLNDTEHPKRVGSLADGKSKTVSISGHVRRDLIEGYYKVPVVVMEGDKDGNMSWLTSKDLKIWVTKSTGSNDSDDDDETTYDFVIGEGQSTPIGHYPDVCNFSVSLRNNSKASVYNVKAHLVPDADTSKFPFEINDVNYDRMFEKIAENETVSLDYSFAVREKAYSGYYLVPLKIYYSKNSTGETLQTYETSFYVHIFNKDKEDEMRDFNEHDREKARIVVDGFMTKPQEIIAGMPFDLTLRMKNASNDISASNLLFSLESEKVSESVVFTTESGSSTVALDTLRPGEMKEIQLRLLSKPGVDQRSYGLKIKAKFDSPKFKNAEENMTIDIPIRQIARLNTGTFEVMPDTVSVGEEANVMFPINNTGKVLLYNVTVRFEADSIQPAEAYVGNIKPGETGNVDCMLNGIAPTADGGTVRVLISYEDENGEVSGVEKELCLFVTEDQSLMDEGDLGELDPVLMEEPGFFSKYRIILLAAGGTAALAAAALAVFRIRRRRKRRREQEEALLEEKDL